MPHCTLGPTHLLANAIDMHARGGRAAALPGGIRNSIMHD